MQFERKNLRLIFNEDRGTPLKRKLILGLVTMSNLNVKHGNNDEYYRSGRSAL